MRLWCLCTCILQYVLLVVCVSVFSWGGYLKRLKSREELHLHGVGSTFGSLSQHQAF